MGVTQISFLEFDRNPNPSCYVKVEKIVECQKSDSIWQKLKTKKYTKSDDDLLRCEDWTVSNTDKWKSVYRVKTIQTKTDRFFSIVFPPELKAYYSLYKQELF